LGQVRCGGPRGWRRLGGWRRSRWLRVSHSRRRLFLEEQHLAECAPPAKPHCRAAEQPVVADELDLVLPDQIPFATQRAAGLPRRFDNRFGPTSLLEFGDDIDRHAGAQLGVEGVTRRGRGFRLWRLDGLRWLGVEVNTVLED